MDDSESRKCVWPTVAGIYALLLAALTLVGVPVAVWAEPHSRGVAVPMPWMAAITAVALAASAVGLLKHRNWGRYAFLVVAPWASIALGSVFADPLWQQDVPYTAGAVLLYAPLAFLLARRTTLNSLGVQDLRWISRGGAVMLSCAVVMVIARLIVMATRPTGGVDFFEHMIALNAYVRHLVFCDVPLVNYVAALIAVSIPTRAVAKQVA
jgi:hypothetical protein